MPLMFTALPLVMLYALGQEVDNAATDLPPQFLHLCGTQLTAGECFQVYLVNQFLLLFMMMPLIIPVAISAYSIVGEKTTRCLEPLLATPVTTHELLIGKGLAAAIPAVLATWIGFGIFAVGARLMVSNPVVYLRLIDPMWLVAIGLVEPLMAIAAINVSLIVSSRVSDPRVAEQVSMVIMLPLLMIFFAQIAGVLFINMQFMLFAALVLALADVGLVYLGVKLFQRETILTQWK
jgi:ABC-2 type transport system permease protein